MGLSSWPDKFKKDPYAKQPRQLVTIEFDDPRYCKATTDNAVLLCETEDGDPETDIWIPKSQLDGTLPERGDIVPRIRVAKWLADEKGLEYEDA